MEEQLSFFYMGWFPPLWRCPVTVRLTDSSPVVALNSFGRTQHSGPENKEVRHAERNPYLGKRRGVRDHQAGRDKRAGQDEERSRVEGRLKEQGQDEKRPTRSPERADDDACPVGPFNACSAVKTVTNADVDHAAKSDNHKAQQSR